MIKAGIPNIRSLVDFVLKISANDETYIIEPYLLCNEYAIQHNARVTAIRFESAWKNQGDVDYIPETDDVDEGKKCNLRFLLL